MKPRIVALNLVRRVLRRGPYSRPVMLRRDKVVVVPFTTPPPPPAPLSTQRIAVVLHIFYPDLAPSLRAACEQVRAPVDILVTTDGEAKAAAVRDVFAGWPRGTVTVTVVANRGRDMPSKFVAYRDVLPGYDLVLFLHSKKSEHFQAGAHDWGRTLVDTLAGSAAIVDSIGALFAADPALGVVFPDHYDRNRKLVNWGENRRNAGALARRIGVELDRARALEYPSGSMFWARPAALVPLLALKLSADDFADEAGQIDGTLAHALERMILFSAEKAGFGWLKVVTTAHHADRGNRVVIPDASRAREATMGTRVRLTDSEGRRGE